MNLFQTLGRFGEDTAIISSSGQRVSYGELDALSDGLADRLGIKSKKLVLILCRNNIATITGYLSAVKSGNAALLLDAAIAPDLVDNIVQRYRPDFVWSPVPSADGQGGPESYELVHCHAQETAELHPDLSLLLTTSGTTGSPRLVRLTKGNLQANAVSIAEYLQLGQGQRPITMLPLHYSYGLSVINSHLLVGATLLLTEHPVVSRPFWDFFREHGSTSIAGVPYTYEMLKRLNFFNMDLPSLRYMTQAGGRLSPALVSEFGRYARDRGRSFFVMYGQTEATARISYLPPDRTLDKPSSIGIPIPGGSLDILNASGSSVTEPFAEGELVYRGGNVMMGYADIRADLEKGDELGGVLHTGDIGYFDEDRFFYITGRQKRFLKIFGNRLNLEDIEIFLKHEGYLCACGGKDDMLRIAFSRGDAADEIKRKVVAKFGLHPSALELLELEELPTNSAGKLHYSRIFGGERD